MERRYRPGETSRERFLEKIPGSRWVLPFFISMLVNAGALELTAKMMEKPSVVSIDGQKLTKEDFIEKLKNETISPEQFVWAQEELALEERTREKFGVENRAKIHKKVQLAQETFEKIIFQAQQKIRSGASKEEVANFIMQFFGEHPDSYNLEGYSTVTELLTEGIGNCEARAKFASIALERLYGDEAHSELLSTNHVYVDPESHEMQTISHVYATLEIDGKPFALNGAQVKMVDEKTYTTSGRVSTKDLQKTFLVAESEAVPFENENEVPDFAKEAKHVMQEKGVHGGEIKPTTHQSQKTLSQLSFPTSGAVEVELHPYTPSPPNKMRKNAILDLHTISLPKGEDILPLVLVTEPTKHDILYGNVDEFVELQDPKFARMIVNQWEDRNSMGLPPNELLNLRYVSPEALEELFKFTDDEIVFGHPEIFLDPKNREVLEKMQPQNIFFSPNMTRQSFQNLAELGLPDMSIGAQSDKPLNPEILSDFFQKQKKATLEFYIPDVYGVIPDSFRNFEGTIFIRFQFPIGYNVDTDKQQRINHFFYSLLQKANSKATIRLSIPSTDTFDGEISPFLKLEGPTKLNVLEVNPPEIIRSFSEGSQAIQANEFSTNFSNFEEQDLGENIGTLQSAVWDITYLLERALIKTLHVTFKTEQLDDSIIDTLSDVACDEIKITLYKDNRIDSASIDQYINRLRKKFQGKVEVDYQ